MAQIRPISDLRNKAREISELVHRSDEPVFITREGKGDMVVMSLASWRRHEAKLELYRLLEESEADERAGDRGITPAQMRKRLAR
jgi:prevent-host-death family protein